MTTDEAKSIVKSKYRDAKAVNFGRKFTEPWSVMLGDYYAFAWRQSEDEAWKAAADNIVQDDIFRNRVTS